ncbi:Gfo/Idh/MocA family oxidoreductase [Cellvibrio sp. NN19]|uniref:Gfo/Idh/MocA family protein n=1 Tax=Cellvibrio chitinivorans TaxID=3102792 RepID=UPI002B4085B0|nr:Gfo/Idh/MocA family oxidoreductase [Cellvibrio sp. NN19]
MAPLNRRELIKAFAALGLATGAAPLFAASSSPKRIGVALVGLGYYSRDLLAPALRLTKHCYLAGVVTGSPEKIPVWQKQYGLLDYNIYNYNNMHEIANNPDIDVVYVVTPTGTHKKFTEIAANAGKHVWCEKPMAMSAAECQSMIDTCKKNNVQLTIGYRMQHESNTQRIMQFAKQKPYGDIKNIIAEAGYNGTGASYSWRADPALGGGAMYDMGVYPLNAARYTAGEEPIAVTARMNSTTPVYKDVDETTEFELEFASGAHAQCVTSYARSMNILRANCEKGWYELKPFQSYSGVQGKTSDGIILPPSPLNQQATQMDNDALSIIHNSPVLVSGEEGMKDIAIVEAIFKAAKTGQRITL